EILLNSILPKMKKSSKTTNGRANTEPGARTAADSAAAAASVAAAIDTAAAVAQCVLDGIRLSLQHAVGGQQEGQEHAGQDAQVGGAVKEPVQPAPVHAVLAALLKFGLELDQTPPADILVTGQRLGHLVKHLAGRQSQRHSFISSLPEEPSHRLPAEQHSPEEQLIERCLPSTASFGGSSLPPTSSSMSGDWNLPMRRRSSRRMLESRTDSADLQRALLPSNLRIWAGRLVEELVKSSRLAVSHCSSSVKIFSAAMSDRFQLLEREGDDVSSPASVVAGDNGNVGTDHALHLLEYVEPAFNNQQDYGNLFRDMICFCSWALMTLLLEPPYLQGFGMKYYHAHVILVAESHKVDRLTVVKSFVHQSNPAKCVGGADLLQVLLSRPFLRAASLQKLPVVLVSHLAAGALSRIFLFEQAALLPVEVALHEFTKLVLNSLTVLVHALLYVILSEISGSEAEITSCFFCCLLLRMKRVLASSSVVSDSPKTTEGRRPSSQPAEADSWRIPPLLLLLSSVLLRETEELGPPTETDRLSIGRLPTRDIAWLVAGMSLSESGSKKPRSVRLLTDLAEQLDRQFEGETALQELADFLQSRDIRAAVAAHETLRRMEKQKRKLGGGIEKSAFPEAASTDFIQALRSALDTLEPAAAGSNDDACELYDLLASARMNIFVDALEDIGHRNYKGEPPLGRVSSHDLVECNVDEGEQMAGGNHSLPRGAGALSASLGGGSELIGQPPDGQDWRGSREDDLDEFGRPQKMIAFSKAPGEDLGITVGTIEWYDENTGQSGLDIVVERIMAGSRIDQQNTLKPYDVIREVNGIPIDSPEKLQQVMRKASGNITLKVRSGFYESSKPVQTYVKALFSYDPQYDGLLPCREAGLKFTVGDVLQVLSQEDPNWWQARLWSSQGRAGLIPSLTLQERRGRQRAQHKGRQHQGASTRGASTRGASTRGASTRAPAPGAILL
uniref:SH3 domain-containing protein n=1 Tax=Macrostomum lignano TaxID=282301 RepID=A0A1I8ICP9_9PLAT